MSRELMRTMAALSLGFALGGFEVGSCHAQEAPAAEAPPAVANEPAAPADPSPPLVEEPGPPVEAEMEQAPGERDEQTKVVEPGQEPPLEPAAPMVEEPGPPVEAEMEQAPGERDKQTKVLEPGDFRAEPGPLSAESAPPVDVVDDALHDGTLFWSGPIAPNDFDEAYFYGYDLPAWKLSAETLFLTRTGSTSSTPFINRMENVQTGQVITNKVQDLTFNNEPGVRLTLTKAITDCSSYIEASYLGLFHWNSQQNFYSDPNGYRIVEGDIFFGLSRVDSQVAAYTNNLHSAEVNLRTDLCYYPFASILMGLRYVHLDEAYVLKEFGADNVLGQLVDARDFRRLSTENEMLGFQVGGNTSLPLGEYLTIGMGGKGGAFVNWARVNTNQNLAVNIPNVTPIIRSTYYDGRNIAGLLEGNLFMSLQLTSNWRVYGGYQLLFMLSAPMAPDQPFPLVTTTDNSTTTIDYPGHVLYHGPFLGTEITWGKCEH